MGATVKVRDVTTGAVLSTMPGHTDVVRSVAWKPDVTLVAAESEDHSVRLWDASTGADVRAAVLRGQTDVVTTVAWSADGSLLASPKQSGTVPVWDVTSGTVKHILENTSSKIFRCDRSVVAWRPDGRVLAIGGSFGTVRHCDVASKPHPKVNLYIKKCILPGAS